MQTRQSNVIDTIYLTCPCDRIEKLERTLCFTLFLSSVPSSLCLFLYISPCTVCIKSSANINTAASDVICVEMTHSSAFIWHTDLFALLVCSCIDRHPVEYKECSSFHQHITHLPCCIHHLSNSLFIHISGAVCFWVGNLFVISLMKNYSYVKHAGSIFVCMYLGVCMRAILLH